VGATFSRTKTWIAETLTAADLNAEFDNILNNLIPAGLDDESASDAAMQAVADPYPGSAISKPTSLTGELQRIRYQLNALVGGTYWYEDALGAANLKRFMNAGATAPEWASGLKVMTSTRNLTAATGDVSYTGIGFKPGALIAIGYVPTGTIGISVGFSVGAAGYSVLTRAATAAYSGSASNLLQAFDGTNQHLGAVKSLDADGFTLTWTKNSSPTGEMTFLVLALR